MQKKIYKINEHIFINLEYNNSNKKNLPVQNGTICKNIGFKISKFDDFLLEIIVYLYVFRIIKRFISLYKTYMHSESQTLNQVCCFPNNNSGNNHNPAEFCN